MTEDKPFQAAEVKPVISPEVLNQIDIRVGRIERVEDMPKSDKLVKLTVYSRSRKAGSEWAARRMIFRKGIPPRCALW